MSEQKSEKEQLAAEQERLEAEQEQLAAAQKAAENAAAVDKVIQAENDDFLDSPEVISQMDSKTAGAENAAAQNDAATQKDAAAQNGAETQNDAAEAQETASDQVRQLSFDPATEMEWPLLGNVIMNYSMDQTIYFATLDQYKYNPAIVIQGNVNDKVRSVADGKVSSIVTNEETGCTVTVDLGDGYSAVYGQLKEVSVSEGAYINAGDIVGYVNEPTKYYSLEGANLYFQLLKDKSSVDPMEYLQ